MKTKKVWWYVRTHIVCNCDIITDEARAFNRLADAEKFFNNIVEKQREIAINKGFVIEYDDKRNFEAHENGRYEHNHICVNLIYMEHFYRSRIIL